MSYPLDLTWYNTLTKDFLSSSEQSAFSCSTMTMEELLISLQRKCTTECKEAHRQLVCALNGLAGIHIIKGRIDCFVMSDSSEYLMKISYSSNQNHPRKILSLTHYDLNLNRFNLIESSCVEHFKTIKVFICFPLLEAAFLGKLGYEQSFGSKLLILVYNSEQLKTIKMFRNRRIVKC